MDITALGAAIAIFTGLGCGLGMGLATGKACEAIARRAKYSPCSCWDWCLPRV